MFFNVVTGIVQAFIKSWNQPLFPRVKEFCRLRFESRHDLHLIIVLEIFQRDVSLGEETSGNHVTMNSNNLLVNFRWTFAFCVEKSNDGTHLAFGGALGRRCHFKHVSHKQSRFYPCQTSTAHMYRIKVDSNVAIISIKYFPIGLHVMYLYFPDTPHRWRILMPIVDCL